VRQITVLNLGRNFSVKQVADFMSSHRTAFTARPSQFVGNRMSASNLTRSSTLRR
jgi:hypothetical protein